MKNTVRAATQKDGLGLSLACSETGPGHPDALSELIASSHGALLRKARYCLKGEQHGYVLEDHELVSEAYLRIHKRSAERW
jgi:hypothetical protein